MIPPPLIVDGFGRRYRNNKPWAVRGVTLAIPHGSITALVGPNGAGKSTLIRACVGFERPDEGSILVSGVNPQRARASAVGMIGYVPQAASLYRGLSIRDHFVLARAWRSSFDEGYARELTHEANLAPSHRVGELSGGEQARVALAIALATRAPLLLLDEPLASLDPLARSDFLATLLDDVRSRAASAILSSHIITDVEQVCDRLVVLGNGRVLLDTDIATARREFATVEAEGADLGRAVGAFTSREGGIRVLVRDPGIGRPASLEEIVLGHLAAGRARSEAEAA
jgi:ABC-2 type transport system ATP-binding protein